MIPLEVTKVHDELLAKVPMPKAAADALRTYGGDAARAHIADSGAFDYQKWIAWLLSWLGKLPPLPI